MHWCKIASCVSIHGRGIVGNEGCVFQMGPYEGPNVFCLLIVGKFYTHFDTLIWFALTFDPTWAQCHSSGPVHSERHRYALLLPSHLQDRSRIHQGDWRGEEDGGRTVYCRLWVISLSECFVQQMSAGCFVRLCRQNILVLAEAGCLDPRIFCTSCMVSLKQQTLVYYRHSDSQSPDTLLCLQAKKPMRTNHCFSCDACVAKHDHHSMWTNCCIGA